MKQPQGKIPTYVDKVPLARRRKPDSWLVVGLEVSVVVTSIIVVLFAFCQSDMLSIYAAKAYAHLGSVEAQHMLSQYHLSKRQDSGHAEIAEYWLTTAANNGHGLAAYNLAVAHLRRDLPKERRLSRERIHQLLTQAVQNGVHEALGLLHTCGHGQCLQDEEKERSHSDDGGVGISSTRID